MDDVNNPAVENELPSKKRPAFASGTLGPFFPEIAIVPEVTA
jgi:hypothetical protein